MTNLDTDTHYLRLPIVIRTANKEDVAKLEWYGQYTHFRNLLRRAYREQMLGRRLMLVADYNDFPIGQLFIQLKSNNRLIADGKRRAYLYSFRVMEMFRGQGIGTMLVNHAENFISNRGYNSVTIAVAKDNHGAIRLYERLGYGKFAEDSGKWSYTNHHGKTCYVHEPCWLLEKSLEMR